MMPMTPRGTVRFSMQRPLGRFQPSSTRPRGSGRAATWRRPSAMEPMRSMFRVRRSTKAALLPALRALSRSLALASRMRSAFFSKVWAICSRARLRKATELTPRTAAASRAAAPRFNNSCMLVPSLQLFSTFYYIVTAWALSIRASYLATGNDCPTQTERGMRRRPFRRQKGAPHPFGRGAPMGEQREQGIRPAPG